MNFLIYLLNCFTLAMAESIDHTVYQEHRIRPFLMILDMNHYMLLCFESLYFVILFVLLVSLL